MKRVFKEDNGQDYQIKVIDLETNTMTLYHQDKSYGLGFVFSELFTKTIQEWGYSSANDMIKKLKKRGLLTNEVDYEEQLKSEKIGFINLGVDRIKRHNRINTNDFKDVIEKLSNYGLGFVDAQNTIIASYLNSIEG